MRVLKGDESKKGSGYLKEAALIAQKSNCLKSKRGVVIVQNNHVIATGYNSPSKGIEACVTCQSKEYSDKKVCVANHAEQRAIRDALRYGYLLDLEGTMMYHIKIKDGKMVASGPPSCFDCAKAILDEDIPEFVLLHEREGKGLLVAYTAKENYDMSLASVKKSPL